jgi:hypothetical protein
MSASEVRSEGRLKPPLDAFSLHVIANLDNPFVVERLPVRHIIIA